MLFLRKTFLVAVNSFREAVRDNIPYVILLSAVALAAFSVLLGEWSVFDREFVVKSVTVSIISLSGLFAALFAGVGQVQREMQKRTIYVILAKPVSKSGVFARQISRLACAHSSPRCLAFPYAFPHLMVNRRQHRCCDDSGLLSRFLRTGNSAGICRFVLNVFFRPYKLYFFVWNLFDRALERPDFERGLFCLPN